MPEIHVMSVTSGTTLSLSESQPRITGAISPTVDLERTDDGVKLFRTYSDAGMYIRQEQTGAVYAEAVDVEDSGMTYAETDTPIEDEIEDGEALNIIMGRDADA